MDSMKFYAFVTCVLLTTGCSPPTKVSNNLISSTGDQVSPLATSGGISQNTGFQLPIPEGFTGPAVVGNTKDYSSKVFNSMSQEGTIIQVTSLKANVPLWDPGSQTQKTIVTKNINKMITGIKNRRTDYSQSELKFKDVEGIQIGQISWSGIAKNGAMKGTMYSFIKNGNTHFISVQGFSENTASIMQAYQAVDELSFSTANPLASADDL